jgi:hypothetical protein
VTTIGGWAFSGCISLTGVVIPNSVTTIGEGAFAYCTSLTSVVIPNSVTTIDQFAFAGCTSLTSVVIGNGVTTIEIGVFAYCTSLTSVVIPNSVTTIGQSAFSNCTSLTEVVIPNSVTLIGSAAFWDCTSLYNIYFQSLTPPAVNTSAFGNVKSGARAIVPRGSESYGTVGSLWNGLIVTWACPDCGKEPCECVTLSLRPAPGTRDKLASTNRFTMELHIDNPSGLGMASFNNIWFGFDSDVLEWDLTGDYVRFGNMPFTAGPLSGLVDPENPPGSTLRFNPPNTMRFHPHGAYLNFDSGEDCNETGGLLLYINLRVKPGADPGVFNPFTLESEGLYDIYENPRHIVLDYDRKIEIIRPDYGRVTGGISVGSNDVTMLRRYIAATNKEKFKENSAFNEYNADVNGDGVIDTSDVTLLRIYVASGNCSSILLGPQ